MIKKRILSIVLSLTFFVGCSNTMKHENYVVDVDTGLGLELGNTKEDTKFISKGIASDRIQMAATLEPSSANLIFPNKYFVSSKHEYTLEKYDQYSEKSRKKIKKFDVYLRDIETLEVKGKIDIKKVFDKYPEYQIATDLAIDITATTIYKGKMSLVFIIEKKPKELKGKRSSELYTLFVSIEDEECTIDDNYSYSPNSNKASGVLDDATSIIYTTDIMEVNGIENYTTGYLGKNPYWRDTEWKDITIFKIKEPFDINDRLNSLFPELNNFKFNKNDESVLTFYFDGLNTEDIVNYFIKNGSEITYEGVTLYGEVTKDGEDHLINSKSEFNEYFEMPEDNIYPNIYSTYE